MRPDAQGFLHILTTPRTFLRRVVRCHSNHLSASTFSLAFKVLPEHPPGCIGYSEGQTTVTYHVGGFQIFDGDGLVVLHILVRGFVKCILSLVSNALMDTSNELLRFFVAVASLLAPGKGTLCSCQFLGTLFRVPGVVDSMSVAISNQIANTHVQTNRVVLLGKGFRFCLADALHIPAGRTQHYTSELEYPIHRTMHNCANAPTANLRGFEVPVIQAVLCITELDRIPGLRVFEAGKANLTPLFETAKEVGEGAVKTFEGGIYDNGGQIRMSSFAVPLILFVEMQVLACLLIVRNQLFETGIVHLARGNQHAHQGLLLCLVWAKAVLKRFHEKSIANSDYIVNAHAQARAKARARLTTVVETA